MAGKADGEEKSKRPANTAFKQQNLKAWRPILTPKTVILTFFIVGIIFVPIGIAVLVTSQNIVEVQSTNYVNAESDGGCCIANCDSVTSGSSPTARVDLNPCVITIAPTEDMDPPIYMYYKLTHFYQNHRMYVKSRDDSQLSGTSGLTPSDTELYCRVGQDSYVGWAVNLDSGQPGAESNISNSISPCGLIAYSLFNDSFRLVETDKDGKFLRVPEQTSDDISWKSDRENKFANAADGSTGNNFHGFLTEKVTNGDCNLLPDYSTPTAEEKQACLDAKKSAAMDPGWCFPGSGWCHEDEHFIVWMRTAGLPSFRKLYAKINEKLKKDSHYRVQIWNDYANDPMLPDSIGCNGTANACNGTLYPVHTFHGDKYVVLSTTAWIGGKNQFLGIAYVVVGAICLSLALAFFIKDRISPRDFAGNPSGNKKGGDDK